MSWRITRRSVLASGAVVGLGGAAAGDPHRIVSLNPCLDVILVHVADRAQIAAISHYSHEPSSSSIGPAGGARHRCRTPVEARSKTAQPLCTIGFH